MTTKPSVAEAVPPTLVPRRAGAMALAIQTVTGQRLAVDDGMRSDTLARLRARISLTHGIAAGTQRLMIDQVTLEEGPQTLAERGIGPQSALFLSLQAADHLITERQSAVAAAETAAAEADTAVQGQVEAPPQPSSRLMLYRDDGSPKHRRWVHLSRDAMGVASVKWGKNKDGSDHTLWASCGSAPPKSCEVHGVSIEEGAVGSNYGFKILRTGQPLLVAAADGETKEKWVGMLDAVQSHLGAVGALEQAREALRLAPAEAARLEEEAQEAQRFVEEVEPILMEAERQMDAEEFGAAVVTLRRALALDKEAWAALDRVVFVLGGRIYVVGDDGRLDLAGQKLGREGVAKLARCLATDVGAASVEVVILDGNPIGLSNVLGVKPGATTEVAVKKGVFAVVDGRFGEVTTPVKLGLEVKLCWLDDGSESGWTKVGKLTSVVASRTDLIEDYSHIRSLGEALSGSKVQTYGLANCKFNPVSLATFVESVRWADAASVEVVILDGNPIGPPVMSIKPGASTGVKVEVGVFAAYNGRFGEVTRDDHDGWVKLHWLDDGTESDIKQAKDLTSVVATRTDLIEDYAHIRSLGEALSGSKVKTYGLANCKFNPVSLATFVESVRWADAAVARLSLRGNLITGSDPSWKRNREFDKDLSGLISLCDALLTLKNPIELDLSKCGVSVNGVNPVAKAISAGATLNLLTVTSTGDKDDPQTYTLTGGEGKIELSNKKLGPADIQLLSAWLATPAAAALNSVTLDSNSIFGIIPRWGGDDAATPDKFVDDCDAFLAALNGSNILTLSLQNTGIGPLTLRKLATSLPAALTSVNRLANHFGEDDLATLLAAIEGTFVRSLCGLIEGQTIADFSGQNLGPIDMKIMATEYGFQGFIAALNSLTLDSNGIFGKLPDIFGNGAEPDKFVADCDAFLVALKDSNITTLSLQKTGIGPVALRKLATSLPAGVAQLILDENPLTGGEWDGSFDTDLTGVTALFDILKTSCVTELGLAKCQLGPGSLGKLAEYVRDAEAALTKIDICGAYIDEEVFAGLKGVAPEGCEVVWK
eukprot:COSAG02_NODE_3620_length_6462_cov_20.005501_3_plen_1051_part_00